MTGCIFFPGWKWNSPSFTFDSDLSVHLGGFRHESDSDYHHQDLSVMRAYDLASCLIVSGHLPPSIVRVVCKSSLGPALGLFEFESSCRSDCLTGHGIVAFLIYLLWLLMDGFGRHFALGQIKMETHIMDRRPILLDRDIILFSMGFNESKKAH